VKNTTPSITLHLFGDGKISGMEKGKESSARNGDGWAKAGKWLKDYGAISGVLILTISGFAYLCAYFYELGFCQQFGIPSDLINISWIRFLTATIKVIALLLAFCIVSLTVGFLMKEFHGKYKRIKSIAQIFFAAVIGVSLLYFFFWITQTIIVNIEQYYVWSLLLVFLLILPLILNRKLLKDQQKSKPLQKGVVLMLFLLFLSLIPLGYNAHGSDDALNDKEYSVLSSNQSIVVLRVYGDKAICAPLSNESGDYAIIKEFIILPLENMTLIPQEIGPLHVKSAE